MLDESAWQVCQRAAVGQQYRDPHYDPMAALPYFQLNVRSIAIHKGGIEPPTQGFSVWRSGLGFQTDPQQLDFLPNDWYGYSGQVSHAYVKQVLPVRPIPRCQRMGTTQHRLQYAEKSRLHYGEK